MARDEYIFTSESVTEGHPDKIADQISDAVLDAVLGQDPYGRVACETLVTTGICMVAGEITTKCYVDVQKIARETIEYVGYACDETPELMPLPIMLAHKLVRQLSDVRRAGKLDFLRPDGKSQVSVEYAGNLPKRIE